MSTVSTLVRTQASLVADRGGSSVLLLGLTTLLIVSLVVSLTLGNYPLSLQDIASVLQHSLFSTGEMQPDRYQLVKNILFDIRAPRLIAAALIGAALSTSGAAFQSMFVNPLVAPGILGVLPGASFGAALGMLVCDSWIEVQFLSFAGGMLAVGFAVFLAKIYKGDRLMMLILGGIISGAFFTSLLSVVKYTADPTDQLPAIVYWLMGGLSMVDTETVAYTSIPILIGITCILGMSRYLNALSMGDEEAKSLGINVKVVRTCLIIFATVISALTVAIGGLIGWVGLVIPHIGRMLVGPNNAILLPTTALIGATYLVFVDDVSRLLLDVEIPLGIITSLVGIPFFSIIMKNAKQGWK
ncbi:FecCD family ABC transporter permease [Pseudodesulfovibrio sediminis]|uniref:Iron ABC transporter permease n=1 Tax=Pseudodesulfovibrio sediminis TaxID=2810563 RepID=A0ABM7P5W2_9BACT|nr:iron ABC transporter permease [Pseudodesulfovibrio sediminis]BCS88980.1 iron ABC transporter permease [Pseudodesulfovibrio sediminis]